MLYYFIKDWCFFFVFGRFYFIIHYGNGVIWDVKYSDLVYIQIANMYIKNKNKFV